MQKGFPALKQENRKGQPHLNSGESVAALLLFSSQQQIDAYVLL